MDVSQLLDYDQWATAQLLQAVESLSPEQFVQEYAGPLSSIRQQFVHLLSVADRYHARMAQEEVPNIPFQSITTPQELVDYEFQVRRRLNDFIVNLHQKDLVEVREHGTRNGVFMATVEQTLQHMVNHATYHRGQIACLLKLQGVDFEDTDFIIWINRL